MNSILKQMFEEIITYGNEFYEMNHRLEAEITNIFDPYIERMELTKTEKESLEDVFFDVSATLQFKIFTDLSATAQYVGFQQGMKLSFRLLLEMLSE